MKFKCTIFHWEILLLLLQFWIHLFDFSLARIRERNPNWPSLSASIRRTLWNSREYEARGVRVRVLRVFAHVLGGSFRSLRLITKWTRIGNGKLALSEFS